MKKIINSKLYDTETAKEMGQDSYLYPRDFGHWVETLYKKRTGEFFLHGVGGPASKYAESCGQNQWSGGEKIIPLTYEAARAWAEEHLDADDYQEIFGAVSEGESDERTTLSISIDSATADRIRREAQEKGMTVSALIASKF